MSSGNIAEYRRKAGECLALAKTTRAAKIKMLWLTQAEDWQMLAEHVEKNLVSDRAA